MKQSQLLLSALQSELKVFRLRHGFIIVEWRGAVFVETPNAAIMQEFASWFHPSCPIEIEYSLQVMEEIRQKSIDGLVSLRRQGLGIGGLLLGTRRGNEFVRVLDYEEIPCSHTLGPGFALNLQEIEALRLRLQQRGQLAVVGMYLTKPRGELNLADGQRQLFERFFPDAYQVALVLRPASLDPCRCVFYFQNQGVLTRGPEWDLQPLVTTSLMESVAQQERPMMQIPIPGRGGFDPADYDSPVAPRPVTEKPLVERPPVVNPIQVRFATRKEEPVVPPTPLATPRPSPVAPSLETPAPLAFAPPQAPTPVTQALPQSSVAPESAPDAEVRAVPVKPITVSFDSKEYKPIAPSGFRQFLSELDGAYKSVRLGLANAFYALLILGLLAGVGYGLYLSRPLWVTPPPANLTVSDDKGTLTFRWNPSAAEFVDAGTISILDAGRRRTIALAHKDLLKGFLDYRRRSGTVTASLALDDRRSIAAFNDPNPPTESAPPGAPATSQPQDTASPAGTNPTAKPADATSNPAKPDTKPPAKPRPIP